MYSALFVVQKVSDDYKKNLSEISPPLQYILPESMVKLVNFGFRVVMADYYWISIIQNSGLSVKDKNLFLKYHYNIGVLDANFAYPYTFAVLWLPTKNQAGTLDAVLPLAERGMKALPNNWEIPYYLAFQYQIIERSFDKTGQYLAIAASKEGVPTSVVTAYTGYLKRLNRDEDLRTDLLQVAYETAKTPSLKKLIGDQLLNTYVTQALDSAALNYKNVYGQYPINIEELAKKNFINLPPGYNNEFIISYNNQTGKSETSLREAE